MPDTTPEKPVEWPECSFCGFPLGSNACPTCVASECFTAWRAAGATERKLMQIRDVLIGHGHGAHTGTAIEEAVAEVCQRLTSAEAQVEGLTRERDAAIVRADTRDGEVERARQNAEAAQRDLGIVAAEVGLAPAALEGRERVAGPGCRVQ